MQINEVTTFTMEGNVAVVTVDSPPVNALGAQVRKGVAEAMTQALADASVAAVVLMCGGRTFFVGADIREFGKVRMPPLLPQVQPIIENASKPVVAAIHGTALGGGLELALVAHYRIAVPTAKLGLPEVKLGILPGAGGTQRLPRVVGAERALQMITSGDSVTAGAAAEIGLVDAIVPGEDLRAEAIAYARSKIGSPLVKIRDRPLKAEAGIFDAFRKANVRKFRNLEAPEAIIQAVEAAVSLPFEAALARESELFAALVNGSQAAALRYVFFAERQAAKVDGLFARETPLPIRKVGVIGAGTMGGGIAMNFANVGIPVTLIDSRQESLDRGLATIRRNYEASAKKGRITAEQMEKRMELLSGSLDLRALADCDLVIEAVFEQMAVKQEVMGKLDAIVKPGAILATNTSYLDIDAIASATSRPEWVVGLHFFSPANVMRLLEIVRGEKTTPAVIAAAIDIARRIGKVGVTVKNGYGFVGNRMLAARHVQADAVVTEGAWPWDVDRVIQDFGFAMGPFAMRDLAGLDVGWQRDKSSSSTLREVLNEAGRHGQKTGGGYYDYDANRRATPSLVVEQAAIELSHKQGVIRRSVTDAEILDRCLLAMVNEGAKILEEGIAQRASDIDTVWINGYGWPRFRGGPMFWADQQGLPKLLAKLKSLEGAHGAAFAPSPLIERLVAENKGFSDAR